DSTGKKYLDFLGGIAVNALGHAHSRIVKVIRREAARAIHLSNLYHHAFQGPLARKLAAWSGMDRVFFSNSGTEAIDGAMKLARLFGRHSNEAAGTTAKKHRFLALENSFHGRTFGAISVTSTEKYRLPFAPGLPLGAILTTEEVASRISPVIHGTTFGGGPLACAVALEFLNIVEDQALLENIRARGAELREGLTKLAAQFDFVREVRGE